MDHLKTLREAIDLRANLRESMPQGLKAFGATWKSDESDADALKRIDEWLGAFVRGIEAHEIEARATAKALDPNVKETLPVLIEDVEAIDSELRSSWTNICQILSPDETIIFGSAFSECEFDKLEAKLSGWVDGLPGLTSWVLFCACGNAWRRQMPRHSWC